MLKVNRELLEYNQKFLEDAGIKYLDTYEEKEFDNEKYIKLDKNIAGKLDMVIQYIPNLILNKEVYNGTYKVIFDKGLGNLQKAAKNPGLFRANIVKEGTNNVVTGQALLKEISSAPQIIGNVFAIASAIIGQYYMEQIDKKLVKIEKTAQEILKFLENDKRSKIESQIEFLLNVQKNYQSILDNEILRESTLVNIQTIKIDASSNIIFYQKKVQELENVNEKKDDMEEVFKNIDILVNSFSEYWYALYSYCFASCMEIYLGKVYDKQYIINTKKDIENKCNQYRNDLKIWKSKIEKYIKEADAFDENKVLKVLKYAKNAPTFNAFGWFAVAAGHVADIVDTIDKDKKEKKKEEAFFGIDKIMPFSNIKQIESKQDDLSFFDLINNGKLEVIKDNEEMYIKIPQ